MQVNQDDFPLFNSLNLDFSQATNGNSNPSPSLNQTSPTRTIKKRPSKRGTSEIASSDKYIKKLEGEEEAKRPKKSATATGDRKKKGTCKVKSNVKLSSALTKKMLNAPKRTPLANLN